MGHVQYRQKQAPQWAECEQGTTNDARDGKSAFIQGVWEDRVSRRASVLKCPTLGVRSMPVFKRHNRFAGHAAAK